MAVGKNQVVFAPGTDVSNLKSEDIASYFENFNLDSDSFESKDNDDTSRKVSGTSGKSIFSLPTSFKSRLAMRKKPVIKWKPYKRPAANKVTEDVKPENLLTDGVFEDECAFMWKTVEDDICTKYNSKEHTIGIDNSSASVDRRILSEYLEHKLADIIRKKGHDGNINNNKLHPKRHKYCPRARRRRMSWPEAVRHHSLPVLPATPPVLANKSVSSQFVDAVAQRLLLLSSSLELSEMADSSSSSEKNMNSK